MSMPITMSAKLALHIAMRLVMIPAHMMMFTAGYPRALRRSPDLWLWFFVRSCCKFLRLWTCGLYFSFSWLSLLHLNVICKGFFEECHVDVKFCIFYRSGLPYMLVCRFDFLVSFCERLRYRRIGLVSYVPRFHLVTPRACFPLLRGKSYPTWLRFCGCC